jgi:hypothetical protein
MNDIISTGDVSDASVTMGTGVRECAVTHGVYHVECYGADGVLKWADDAVNLWTTAGKNDALDKYIGGSAYTQTFVMGLKGTGAAAAADTQASHVGWLEVGLANAPTYSGTRKTPAFSAASAGSKATSAAVAFSMTSSGTVAGCFLNNGGSATQDNTTGVLFSAGDFVSGSRTVANGDTLNVTYTATLT